MGDVGGKLPPQALPLLPFGDVHHEHHHPGDLAIGGDGVGQNLEDVGLRPHQGLCMAAGQGPACRLPDLFPAGLLAEALPASPPPRPAAPRIPPAPPGAPPGRPASFSRQIPPRFCAFLFAIASLCEKKIRNMPPHFPERSCIDFQSIRGKFRVIPTVHNVIHRQFLENTNFLCLFHRVRRSPRWKTEIRSFALL